MPTLDWIGRDAVVDHHRRGPFHVPREDPELSVGDVRSGNLLIQGGILLALKALLACYAGAVTSIYIDPLYNAGNDGQTYKGNIKLAPLPILLPPVLTTLTILIRPIETKLA